MVRPSDSWFRFPVPVNIRPRRPGTGNRIPETGARNRKGGPESPEPEPDPEAEPPPLDAGRSFWIKSVSGFFCILDL